MFTFARRLAAVTLCATALTLVFALPVVTSPTTRIFGDEIVGRHYDPFAVIEQFREGGTTGVTRQPLTDDLGARIAIAVGPVAAYNVIVLASFPLAAAAAYGLTCFLTRSHRAAVVSGVAFAFAPVHVAQAAYHPHVAQVQWIPLYLWALFAAIERPIGRRLALLVLAAGALVFSNFYGGLIGLVITPIAASSYWLHLARSERQGRRLVLPVLILILGAVAVIGTIYWRWPDLLSDAFDRRVTADDLARYGARWQAYLMPPVDHAVLGAWAREYWRHAGVTSGLLEQQLSLGVGVLFLIFAGLCRLRWHRRPPSERRLLLMLFAIGTWSFIASLTIEGGDPRALWGSVGAVLHRFLPMFRSYARFGIVVSLIVAILAGMAADALLCASPTTSGRRRMLPSIMAGTLLAAAAFEFAPMPWRTRDVLPTQGHRWLAARPDAVRALDCTPVTRPDETVPLLMGAQRLSFIESPFEGCADPFLIEKLVALNFTHVIVRRRSELGSPSRSIRLPMVRSASFPDAEVYSVPEEGPAIVTLDVHGFYPWESDASVARRWMGQEGRLTVRNRTPHTQRVSLDVELSPLNDARTLSLSVDGSASIDRVIRPLRQGYALGPFSLPPGDHELTLRVLEPATHSTKTADPRLLTVMFGVWTWLTW